MFEGNAVRICFKKIKNKPTTILANIEPTKREEICKKLKVKLGCGGSIDKENGHVILQGNQITKILTLKKDLLPDMDVLKVESL